MEPGATTVPLAKSPAGGPRPGAPAFAGAPGGAVGATQQLPKATVQLAKGTTPLQQQPVAPPSAPVKRTMDEADLEDEKDPEAGLAPLAIVCFVLAIGLMLVNMFATDKVVGSFPEDKGLMASLMVPRDKSPTWEERQLDGTHVSKFNKVLDDIKKKFE
jgi:hypothetical protein